MVWDASRDSESPSHVIAEMINYAESECLRLKRRKRKFTSGEIDIITKCIVPEFVGVPCHNRSKNTTDTELKRFYDDKLSQISEALENPRIVFNGVAGSGKTLLALGLSRIFRKAEPKSTIAVVCYNKLLADWLKLQTQDIEPDEKFWVGSVHALIKQKYNLSDDTLTDKNKLLGVIELLSNFRPTQQFDYLIIDEGQDFLADINEGFITLLDKLLKGGFRDGNCYWFQDLKQSVLRGNPSDENLLFRNYTKINMKDNIRNPKSVANFAKDFGRDKIMVVKHEELGVRSNEIFTSLDLQERRAAVERMLKKLYDKSYAPDDIVLLRYESKMSDCLAGISSLGGYHIRPCDQFDIKNESIKCTTVRKFKGMESRVIIIYDIYSDDSLSIPLMYVGSTRAKHFLGLVYSDSVQDQFFFIEE